MALPSICGINETGQQNWTQGFDDEFKRRMGYDVIKHLPVVTGRVISSPEYTRREPWDPMEAARGFD